MTGWQPHDPYSTGQPQPWPAGVPAGGYLPPPQLGQPGADPLVSLDFNGWWQRGIMIVRRGWRPLAAVQAAGVLLTLLVQAPPAIYLVLTADDLERTFTTTDTPVAADFAPLLGVLGLTVLATLLGVVVSAVITLAVVHIGVSAALGAPQRVNDALKLAARRVLPLIGWQLLAIPLYVVAVCFCVLPVFYVMAVFAVLPAVVAVERTNAFSRCFTLFHRDFGASAARIGTVIGLLIATGVVGGLLGGLAEAAINAAVPGTGGLVAGAVVATLVGALLGGAAAVLVAPLTLTAYADMRARTEPVNALVIAQELGIAAPASQPW
ncbi:hypothetical protein O7635_27525 [Asanoa sp. WMMD1127]|uniref:hypothetical protein n=1 Tax=Asanoa sp. WMMD1127 TaxID=3016107 RepID=UPI002416EB0E|nr:hypothetical protein [Asanoa sp. WMMD1127]MDG4825615.1 hypothetical protein [Asanoa sp. WMMD1127]